MLHKDILSSAQQGLLPFLRSLGPGFSLCGGTAIALHLGHRESIDFDLFTHDELSIGTLRKKLVEIDKYFTVLVKNEDEYTVVAKGVKITFLHYPFLFEGSVPLDGGVWVPDLLTLAAMKAYALGRRSKWKDYVDLYFILSEQYRLADVVAKAQTMFDHEFNEKVFRAALAYFEDIDYSEAVVFRPERAVDDETIRSTLRDVSVQ